MFNSRFHMAKRPFRQDVTACIAFWGASTHKTGPLPPESLQRRILRSMVSACFCILRPVSVSCPTLRGVPDQISRLDGGKVGPLAPVFRPRLALHMSHFCPTSVPLLSHFCPTSVPVLYRFCPTFVPDLYRYPLRGVPVPPNSATLNDIATLHAVILPLKTVVNSHTHYAPAKLV